MTKSIADYGVCEAGEAVTDMLQEVRIVVADICSDSKRLIGCHICPLYKCARRDL